MLETTATSSLVPDAVWVCLDLPEDGLRALRRRVEATPAEHGLRGAFLSLIRPALASVRPDAVAAYDRIETHFPKCSPFGFQSLQVMMVLLAAAGHLYRPELPLEEASNELAATGTELVWNVHVMRPLIAACEGDIARLLEAYATSPRITFTRGDMLFERRGRREAVVYYDGIPSDALSFVAAGFWRAVLRRLELRGEVSLQIYGPLSCELIVRWRS